MKNLLKTAAAGLFLIASATGWAGMISPVQKSTDKSFRFMPKAVSTYTPKAVDQNGVMTPDEVQFGPYFQDSQTIGTVYSPEGEEWFYTLDLEGERLNPDNPYYREMNFTDFLIKVYDASLNFVGQAKGKVTMPEGSLKCRRIDVSAQLTRTFFNSSSTDIEVMLALAFNPGPDANGNPRYGAKQTTQVYTLTNEIPAGGSKLVFSAPGYYISAINTSKTISENYTITFVEETSWDGEDVNHADFVFYTKAGWGTSAKEVARFKIDLIMAAADGLNEAVPCVVTAHDGEVYVAKALYEKTFLEDPTTTGDPVMSKDNNYVIDLYKLTDTGLSEIKTVKIPCEQPGEDFFYRSYAIGNFSNSGDITFNFGDGNTPAFIITVVDSDNTDNTSAYYAIYDLDGKEIKRFGESSDGYVHFSAAKGQSDQYGFEMNDKNGDYGTVLINYPSLEEVGCIPQLFAYDDDAWVVISVPDRVSIHGKVYYVASALPSGSDGNGAAHYVAWFNPDGSLDHLDSLYLGENVAKVLSYIHASVLNPYLFNTDSKIEYLCWVYRYINPTETSATSLELAVCDNTGRIIAARKMPDAHVSDIAYVSNPSTTPYIVINYRNAVQGDEGQKIRNEFIRLPLNNFEGEGTEASPYIIKTFGDLDLVRNNLTSYFRLASNIDCEGYIFRPVEGTFTGTIDGNGFEILNLTIQSKSSGTAMFETFGARNIEGNPAAKAVMKNISFLSPKIEIIGTSIGSREISLIANKALNAEFNNVTINGLDLTISEFTTSFGTMAHFAENTTFEGCGATDTHINLSRSQKLGGLVGESRGCKFSACAFSGSLSGTSNVAGMAATLYVTPTTMTDIHVNADIAGVANIGGVIGMSNRSSVLRALVEGTISAQGYAGGIMGYLTVGEDDEDPGYIAVANCVVALDKFDVPAKAESTHRIVGYSRIDLGPTKKWLVDPNDPEKGEYIDVPPTHEDRIGTNYVVTTISPLDSELPATEGTNKVGALSEANFLQDLGYQFATTANGASIARPWVNTNAPELFFEASSAALLQLSKTEIEGSVNAKGSVVLTSTNLDLTAVTYTSSNPGVAEVAGITPGADNGEATAEIKFLAEGDAVITFSCGIRKASLYVHVTLLTGIDEVSAATAMVFDGTSVVANGCEIEVFDTRGAKIAGANNAVSVAGLATGIYIARATAADGSASTLKIAVK